MKWKGVMPALTTGFTPGLAIDIEFIKRHVSWLIENGCTGIVANGSLGEGATLSFEEKQALWKACIEASDGRVPVVASIAALSTDEGIKLARAAERAGCAGLMVLPPYVHKGDWRENHFHVSQIFNATELSCMLYNNPIAYGTDFLPEQIAELASQNKNFHALKESSGDVRRVTAVKALLAERLAIFIGLDDAIVEGINAGAVGWIAGLVNALPKESIALFELASTGKSAECAELYKWFLPLLRLDTVPKFVQLIKLVQETVKMGNTNVRPPRLKLSDQELNVALELIERVLRDRPELGNQ
ncbi:MAG: dihydrodipicolinate synthase family protein [Pyrinomonadaceae bacterium]